MAKPLFFAGRVREVIGTTFVWEDLVAYTVGVVILLCLEKSHSNSQSRMTPP
ncbi:hypothetical protein IQ254_27720 [Nodosilinea sp. LEGE 07088]|uniref:hypothetical protein n=1 Tax=Nodosilinea sp. LEGE 07088 TaxID=2777968 RepID=UPI0018829256|nr:hypothetical protein [Nodosilinea sp. LEGE 07088]MBE9140943.1 hypothetical protein [Nodosilinea sp. LEGE 07088]